MGIGVGGGGEGTTTRQPMCSARHLVLSLIRLLTVGQVILATKKVANCKKTLKTRQLFWSPSFLSYCNILKHWLFINLWNQSFGA